MNLIVNFIRCSTAFVILLESTRLIDIDPVLMDHISVVDYFLQIIFEQDLNNLCYFYKNFISPMTRLQLWQVL